MSCLVRPATMGFSFVKNTIGAAVRELKKPRMIAGLSSIAGLAGLYTLSTQVPSVDRVLEKLIETPTVQRTHGKSYKMSVLELDANMGILIYKEEFLDICDQLLYFEKFDFIGMDNLMRSLSVLLIIRKRIEITLDSVHVSHTKLRMEEWQKLMSMFRDVFVVCLKILAMVGSYQLDDFPKHNDESIEEDPENFERLMVLKDKLNERLMHMDEQLKRRCKRSMYVYYDSVYTINEHHGDSFVHRHNRMNNMSKREQKELRKLLYRTQKKEAQNKQVMEQLYKYTETLPCMVQGVKITHPVFQHHIPLLHVP